MTNYTLSAVFLLLASGVAVLGLENLPKRTITTRIINGQQASAGRYPYFVSLVFQDNNGGCGASLIGPEWVLSAAHCFDQANPPARVLISDFDFETFAGGAEERIVKTVIVHPGYDEITNDNDFMLIELTTPSSHNPVAIDDGSISLTNGDDVTVMGFGDILPKGDPEDGTVSSFPRFLQEVVIDFVGFSTCNANYADVGGLSSNMMCAGGNNKDSCQGDSGGPLIVKGGSADADVQVGVVSWGIGCAQSNRPGVYARISSQLDFINEFVNLTSSASQPKMHLMFVLNILGLYLTYDLFI